MNVDEGQLFGSIEATLVDFLPLPSDLGHLPGSVEPPISLGRLRHGRILSWREAWEAISNPDFDATWKIVPLRGGRVILAHAAHVEAVHVRAADAWQARATGILGVLAALPTPLGRA